MEIKSSHPDWVFMNFLKQQITAKLLLFLLLSGHDDDRTNEKLKKQR